MLFHRNRIKFHFSLFETIEAQKETLGITSYGASITNMEEVFLKVGEINTNGDEHEERVNIQDRIEARHKYDALAGESSSDPSEVSPYFKIKILAVMIR